MLGVKGVDSCEGNGLGVGHEFYILGEVTETYHVTFSGSSCAAGDYFVRLVASDKDGNVLGILDFEYSVSRDDYEHVTIATND